MNDELHKLGERVAWLERKTAQLLWLAILAVGIGLWLLVAPAMSSLTAVLFGVYLAIFIVVAKWRVFRGAPIRIKDIVKDW